MNINHTSTRRLKYQNILFILLFLTMITLLAILSKRYIYLSDWTVNGQNSLNEISLQLLNTLNAPVKIVSYTNNNQLKKSIREIIKRYQRNRDDISLSFVDPNTNPQKMRALNISVDGELIVSYEDRQEHLTQLSEQDLSNALHRLIRVQEKKIIFIQGHGERHPERQANFDLSDFSRHLQKQGFYVGTLNLAEKMIIPDDINILVIAAPQAEFLPGEVQLLIAYVNRGGNLLWLGEPLKSTTNKPLHGLLPLAELLGIEFLEGVIVDPGSQKYGISRPDYAIISEYPEHAINKNFSTITLFPQAAGIERLPDFNSNKDKPEAPGKPQTEQSSFNIQSFLNTVERSWLETSPLKGTAQFSDLMDTLGPISIAMALNRAVKNLADTALQQSENNNISREQRIVVLGDGDFLSNTFLGNAGNLLLGMNIFNWLSHDEQFISIPSQIREDIILDISPRWLAFLGAFFLLFIPAALVTTGSIIWFKRRNR